MRGPLITHTAGSYASAQEAEKAASVLRAEEEDGWEYRVDVSPLEGSGRAVIKVYDEDGLFVHNY